MAKLFFRYGAMNCGKTTMLLQVAHNYEQNNKKIIILKPKIDTKGDKKVVSRLGIEREVDYLIDKHTKIKDIVKNVDAILVDEAQFLTKENVFELLDISIDIPVLCYGLRTDFLREPFEGATYLLALAHDIVELKNICSCGKKAIFNLRKIDGNPVFSGSQVEIDNQSNITYHAICNNCYKRLEVGE